MMNRLVKKIFVISIMLLIFGCQDIISLFTESNKNNNEEWQKYLFNPVLTYKLFDEDYTQGSEQVLIVGWETTFGPYYDNNEQAVVLEKINNDPWGAEWGGFSIMAIPENLGESSLVKFKGSAIDNFSFNIKLENIEPLDIRMVISHVNTSDSSEGISAHVHPDTGETKIDLDLSDIGFSILEDQPGYVNVTIDLSNVSEFTGIGMVIQPSKIGDKVYLKDIFMTKNGNPVLISDLFSLIENNNP